MHAFVLAGGESRRMGRDKAQLALGGRLLIERAVELLRPIDPAPRICGSRSDLARYGAVVPDRFPRCGPLAGIEAALADSDSELNLFLPVDLPEMTREFLQWMAIRAETSRAVATIPCACGRPQPLCAIYGRPLLDGLSNCLRHGDFKVMRAIGSAAAGLGEAIDFFHVEAVAAALRPGEWPSSSSPAAWFHNVNTPLEYDQLRNAET